MSKCSHSVLELATFSLGEWTNFNFFDKIRMVIKMIRTVFMGTPDFAVPILNTLIKNTEVILVVTQPDRYVGRKKILTFSPVKKRALECGISAFQPVNIKSDFQKIEELKPDLIVTCAYGQILSREVLDLPRLGCINVHASLLPKYRGGAPIQRAIMNNDKETGITIMSMDVGMDTGDIIAKRSISIHEEDTYGSLSERLSELGASLLEEVLPGIIKGTYERTIQDDHEATYAPIIKREDEKLDFTKKAQDIFCQVRALNPHPLAYFLLNGEEIKVIDGYVGVEAKKEAGKIEEVIKDAIGIACQDNIYYITKLKPFGKKEMMARDYINGISKEKLEQGIIG